ncbi:MAG: SapC family protein [Alphaproteobacteria bacterium]|nr:SapC family protein [Alphaproteobacteria bacterium]
MADTKKATTQARTTDTADTDKQPPSTSEPERLPLFYKQPEPLSPERHGAKSLRPLESYGIAANTNALPLNAVEFPLAARHYPIVFTQADPAMPVAVVGLRTDQNLFVSASDGSWADNAYIPAYVRRYPFIFMDGPDDGQYILCVDETSELLVDGEERPLFDGEKPSDVADNALKFCSSFHRQYTLTQAFAQGLAEKDLLMPNQAKVKLPSGEELGLGGFRIVDENKFNGLADEVFLDWRKKGWIGLIYAHFFSGANWAALANRVADRP